MNAKRGPEPVSHTDHEVSADARLAAQARLRRLLSAWTALWPGNPFDGHAVDGIAREINELSLQHPAEFEDWLSEWFDTRPELKEADGPYHPARARLWALLDIEADTDPARWDEAIDLFSAYPDQAPVWLERWRRMRAGPGDHGQAGQLVERTRDPS